MPTYVPIPKEALNGGWRLATKTVTFTGAANLGAVGAVPLFTVSGDVQIGTFAAECTTNLVDAGGGTPASLAFGVTGNTALFGDGSAIDPADAWGAGQWIAQGTNTAMAGGRANSNSHLDYMIDANIIGTVANESIDSGVIVVYVWWRPLSLGATLVAA